MKHNGSAFAAVVVRRALAVPSMDVNGVGNLRTIPQRPIDRNVSEDRLSARTELLSSFITPSKIFAHLLMKNLGRCDSICLSLMGMQFVQTCNLCLRKEKFSQFNDTVNL